MSKPLIIKWVQNIPEVSKSGFIIKSFPSVMQDDDIILKSKRMEIRFGDGFTPYFSDDTVWINPRIKYIYNNMWRGNSTSWINLLVKAYNKKYNLVGCQCNSGLILCKACLSNVRELMQF